MSLSEIFIRRPVATMLLALGLFLAGVVSLVMLPVAPLPKVDFPTVQVSARLPGADPETMAATVAAPLERRLGEIPGVTELTSTSSQGSTSIVAQFDLDRDIDGAAHDVQAAINAAAADLAVDLPSPPIYRKVNPADSPILILAVTSDTLPPSKVYDAADAILAQRISQVEGVAQVSVSGAEKPAVRVRVNPAALASMGLGLEDVRTTLAQANVDMPKGSMDGEHEAMSIASNDQLFTASGYAPLVVRSANGAIVRLSAIASVIDATENSRLAGWFNRDRAVLVIISKQPGANVIATVDNIKRILPQLERWMPAGAKVSVLTDRTGNIRGNLLDVERTLLITIALVVLVVYMSLGRITPTVAASITVPLSLSATFSVMWLLDYSLDNISLMALTISVGFVVDDAIVMIENISRHLDRGEGPLEAAIKGAREITFTVISISLSLVAVFIPLLFMGGVIGRLFREFSVTLAVAIAASALVSLTVTPTIFGHLMLRAGNRPPMLLARIGEAGLNHLQVWYEKGLHWVLRHQLIMLGVTAGTVVLTVFLYIQVPKGFFPPQDTGMIIATVEGRTDISFRIMAERQQKVAEVILADPAVEGLGSFVGAGGGLSSGNQGRMFISLKPLDQRKIGAQDVINRLRPKVARVEGVSVFMQPGQDIRVGGRPGKAMFQFVLWDESLAELLEWTPKLIARLKREPGLTDVSSDQDAAMPQESVVVDRDAAARMGVSMQDVDQVLQDAFAQRQVSTIYTQRNQYHVVLEVDPRDQEDPSALHKIYVKSNTGVQVPLDALARLEPTTAPVSVSHQGQFPAATLSFNLAPGTPLSEAAKTLQNAARDIAMPAGVHTEFAGSAKVFAESLRDQPILIGAALLTIYIVLGVLYESTLHPLTIISTLPSAGIGALLALLMTGTELTIISVIGVILLMGIVKKNGIILVDFAIEAEHRRGIAPVRSILAACRKRFRPITMTTLTALLGAVPLAMASGAGGALRQPLGIAIVGGLLLSQFITVYTTPVVYLSLARLSRWWRRRRQAAIQAAEALP
jgi:hydrophobe/amphiphile efflux-1 (HAE1) family protein